MGETCAENGRTEATKKSGGYASGGEESERPTRTRWKDCVAKAEEERRSGVNWRTIVEDRSEWRKIVDWTE